MRWKDKICVTFRAVGLEGQYWLSVTCEAVDEIFVRINLHDEKILSEMFRKWLDLRFKSNSSNKIQNHSPQPTKLCICMLTGTYFRNDWGWISSILSSWEQSCNDIWNASVWCLPELCSCFLINQAHLFSAPSGTGQTEQRIITWSD